MECCSFFIRARVAFVQTENINFKFDVKQIYGLFLFIFMDYFYLPVYGHG
jgi:hypothetical protein